MVNHETQDLIRAAMFDALSTKQSYLMTRSKSKTEVEKNNIL
jgi:hypothetical protein